MIAILGGGLAGLSAAYHLDRDYRVFEKESTIGGLCRSVNHHGYIFDNATHILFTRDPYVRQLYQTLLRGNLREQERRAYIYMQGTYVKYPFEVNLHPLPEHVREECIRGVIEKPDTEPHNFKEWIRVTFGEGIARHYMEPYNEKVWKYPLDQMNTDWIAGRVPSPSVEEMRLGAEETPRKDYGPNARFMYPHDGGIGSLSEQLGKNLKVSTGSNIVSIKPRENSVRVTYTKNGHTVDLESCKLLSSGPLPETVKMMDDVPTCVQKAADGLICNSIVCVMLGVKRPDVSDKHWLYFPEKDVVFNRVSFPMNLSPRTTPPGRSSILVEVTYRGDTPDIKETKDAVLAGLNRVGLLRESDEVEVCEAACFRYAYVVFDLHYKRNVETIHRYLRENNVVPIGRFGEWGYFNIDKAILSGKSAAEQLRGTP